MRQLDSPSEDWNKTLLEAKELAEQVFTSEELDQLCDKLSVALVGHRPIYVLAAVVNILHHRLDPENPSHITAADTGLKIGTDLIIAQGMSDTEIMIVTAGILSNLIYASALSTIASGENPEVFLGPANKFKKPHLLASISRKIKTGWLKPFYRIRDKIIAIVLRRN